jgi:hypothetical protein
MKYTSQADFVTYYQNQVDVLHKKKLYILNEYLTNKIESATEVEKYYKYDVAVVSREVLKDAIITQDTTIAFLSIVAPVKNWGGQKAYYRIFTTDKGECLISYERSVSNSAPAGVVGYDLKTFNLTIFNK